ncbi:hypothetical protein K502DRAFT_132558 [Neoconidiobolus thromboides FSU 785]|nr:hypothetical protein K502DRAFT_132558 [Neoconidiobolus thromboides FSU 785]
MLEDKFNLLNQLFENDKQQEAWKLLDSTFEIIVKGDIQTKWITQFHNILLFQLKDSLKDGKDSIEKRIKIIESYFVHDKLILFSINNLLFYIKLQLKEKESQRIITTCLYLLNQIVINIEFEAILEKNKKNKSFVIALTDTLAFLTDKVCSWNIFVNEKWSFGNKR